VLSSDLGYFRERILPGAFTRALKEKQDVRHLVNHDANLVLGRTKSGTTELSEDKKGLSFRTLLPDTSYARNLAESVKRGDIDECSFGFIAQKTNWIQDDTLADESMQNIRELVDCDLFDISSVTFPAYPQTNTGLASRSLFPDGVPAEIRSHVRAAATCQCNCDECQAGDCADCSNVDCFDENCDHVRSKQSAGLTKRVDGEDLKADAFLIVGDPADIRSWRLPHAFSTKDKTVIHLRNNLARFNEISVPAEQKTAAWRKLVQLCRQHELNLPDGGSLSKRLTAEQIADLRAVDGPVDVYQAAGQQIRLSIEEISQTIARAPEDRAAALAACQNEFAEIARVANEAIAAGQAQVAAEPLSAGAQALAKVRAISASL